MKTFKSLLPEIQLRYKTTELKKVKIVCSEDGYRLLKQLYEEDTLEYLETSVALFLNRRNAVTSQSLSETIRINKSRPDAGR